MLETSLEDLSVQINDREMKQDTKYHNLRKRYAGFLEEIQKYIKGDQGKSLLLDVHNQIRENLMMTLKVIYFESQNEPDY